MAEQTAELEWRDGRVPVSTRFNDPYFSLDDGLAETAHVFLDGNGLPGRFRPGFRIAELGFGTGLNLAAALMAWRKSGVAGPLRFTSFEAYPMAVPDMIRALDAFPGTAEVLAPVLAALAAGETTAASDDLIFELIAGDANSTLPDWAGQADAWFLDGFAPAKNPDLWGADLLAELGRHTAPCGTAATYTAAGHVRRALEDAGFEVARRPGFGRKRHMTTARLAAA